MSRKSIMTNQAISQTLKDLKASLKLKNESEVIGYLYGIYENHYPRITLPEHEKALQRMKELQNQLTI